MTKKATKTSKDPKLQKAEDEEKEAENEEGAEDQDEEELKKMKNAKKSDDLTQDDLEKSLEKLGELATKDDSISRKEALLEKAKDTDLDKSEQAELFQLLGGPEVKNEESLSEEITKGMEDNEDLQKALDVSDYLQEHQDELKKSLGLLADFIEKSDNRQHEYNLVLAKAVSDIGKLTQSLDTRIETMEGKPARAPKAKGTQALEKSFGNQPQGENTLSKSQILDAMEEMIQKSVGDGQGGATVDGIDLVTAASKYESFSQMSPVVYKKVQAHIQSKGASIH